VRDSKWREKRDRKSCKVWKNPTAREEIERRRKCKTWIGQSKKKEAA
jgi:hypothetical protein